MSHMTDKQITEFASHVSDKTKLVMKHLAEQKTESKGGPAIVGFALLNDLGQERLDSLPVPGTETGNNPDKFKIEEVVQGKSVKKTYSVLTMLYDATVGKEWSDLKADYALATSNQADIRAKASDLLQKKTTDELVSEKNCCC